MKRRSFLKFLGIIPLAPKLAIDVISKIPNNVARIVPWGRGRKEARDALAAWFAEEYDKQLFEYLSGDSKTLKSG